jgi:hypothetical protein
MDTVKNVSLKLTEGLERKLAATARGQHTAKSNLLRLAIHACLGDSPGGRVGSCLDLAGSLIGCVDATPDLSTNRAYLKGFGE